MLGGHIYHRPGRGKSAKTCANEKLHANDTKKGLEYLGNWLINIAQTGSDEFKKNLLIETSRALLPFTSVPFNTDTDTTSTFTNHILTNQAKILFNEPPSLFMIKLIFKKEIEMNSKTNFEIDFEKFGRTFGQKLWNSRSDVKSKKSSLESPQTIQEYYNAFPKFLNDFFSGMIDELYQKKIIICNMQRKKRQKSLKIIIPE
jgi:hypothetical protein